MRAVTAIVALVLVCQFCSTLAISEAHAPKHVLSPKLAKLHSRAKAHHRRPASAKVFFLFC